MPLGGLAAIGLAVARRRYEATPLLKRRRPEATGQDFIVADVGNAARCLSLLEQHEAPRHRKQLTLAVGRPYGSRGRSSPEDRGLRYDNWCPIVRHPEQAANGFDVSGLRVEVAHARGCSVPRSCLQSTWPITSRVGHEVGKADRQRVRVHSEFKAVRLRQAGDKRSIVPRYIRRCRRIEPSKNMAHRRLLLATARDATASSPRSAIGTLADSGFPVEPQGCAPPQYEECI